MTENVEQVESSVEDIDQELVGIGGWLILHAIGFVLGPIVGVYELVVSLSNYSKAAKAGYGGIYIIEPVVFIGLFCFFVYIAILFFRKKSNLPGTFITFFIVSIFASGLLLVIELNTEAKIFLEGIELWFVKAIIRAAIWIPYFIVSKRVKATFVN